MKEEGAPKYYPLVHIANALGENPDFDEFVGKLCDEIKETMDVREETLEPVWKDCELNYWANESREWHGSRESMLDFTITFEICKAASANISNPVFSQDQVFTAKARPGFPMIAATHDTLLDWITDRSDPETYVNDLIRHAEIYTKGIIKSPWIVKTRKIKFWETDENGEPYESEREEVVQEGSFPYIVDPRRIYHPIPCANIDEAPWFCEEFTTRPAEIKKKKADGYYRSDLNSYTAGDQEIDPSKEIEDEELFIANALKAGDKSASDYSKRKLMECYTSYEGNECVIILDIKQRTWLAAHSPFYQEFPRCYADFSWHSVAGSIDGKSLCGVLDQLHRAYVAIMNILLDAGVRAIEPLVIALKGLKLSQMLQNGQLGPGLIEVEKLVIDKLANGIHQITLTTGQVAFLLEMLERIERHMRNAGSIPPAFHGEELAQRPTATGTTSIMEKAMQPLYELMTRFRKTLTRIIEIQYSQYRQFNPESLRIFIDAQPPQESSMMDAMLVEFPSGYWRDQVILEPKVNSQTMSKSVKMQESLALVDKIPQIADTVLSLGEAATSGGPISPAAGNMLDVVDLVIQVWLTEFGLPEVRDALNIQGAKMAGESIAQAWQQLQGIIEEQEQKIIDLEAEVVDRGGEIAEPTVAGGGPGPA